MITIIVVIIVVIMVAIIVTITSELFVHPRIKPELKQGLPDFQVMSDIWNGFEQCLAFFAQMYYLHLSFQ